MISIIICSRTATIAAELKSNINDTIGVDYEMVVINNQENKYSIFEAYNMGVAQSRYPYLCFMHDDIEYTTANWGLRVMEYFGNAQTGAIGIAGGPYAATMPGSWWAAGYGSMYILPPDPNVTEPNVSSTYKEQAHKHEVLLLDGVWFCIRKSLFDRISFDSKNFKGFHFYDVDISMQIIQSGYKLFAITDILIRHFGKGDINLNWCNNAMVFNKKWQASLPRTCIDLTYNERCNAEYKTLSEYLGAMQANGYSKKVIIKMAIARILKFRQGYFYFKAPAYLARFINSCLRS